MVEAKKMETRVCGIEDFEFNEEYKVTPNTDKYFASALLVDTPKFYINWEEVDGGNLHFFRRDNEGSMWAKGFMKLACTECPSKIVVNNMTSDGNEIKNVRIWNADGSELVNLWLDILGL